MKHGRSDVARGKSPHSTKLGALSPLVVYISHLDWVPPLLRPGQYLHSITNNRGHYVDPQPGTRRYEALKLPGGLKDAKR